MRIAIISCCLVGFFAAPAVANDRCADRRSEALTRDHCRAAYIQVETEESGWRTVRESDGPFCFGADGAFWRWQCRGFEESSRCRKGGDWDVRVTLVNGEVRWECLRR